MNMEKTETSASKTPTKRSDPVRKVLGTNARTIKAFLRETNGLAIEDYRDFVHGTYERAALYVLARVACSGDVRALALYFEVLATHQRERASRAGNARNITPEAKGFIASRATTSDPTTSD